MDASKTTAIATMVCGVVKTYEGHCPGLVFVRTIATGRIVAHMLSGFLGLEVPLVTSKVSQTERAKIAERVKACDPELPIVVSTDCWGTGVNLPAVKLVVLTEMGRSAIRLLQQIGRGLRRHGDRELKVVDIVSEGNVAAAQDRQDILEAEGLGQVEVVKVFGEMLESSSPGNENKRGISEEVPSMFNDGVVFAFGIMLIVLVLRACTGFV